MNKPYMQPFNFEWLVFVKKKILSGVAIILKTVTGLFPLTCSDASEGAVYDYEVSGNMEPYYVDEVNNITYKVPSTYVTFDHIQDTNGNTYYAAGPQCPVQRVSDGVFGLYNFATGVFTTEIVTTDYLTFTANSASVIKFQINGTLSTTPTISYSLDGGDWTAYTFGTDISISQGSNVRFKGNNNSWSEGYGKYISFVVSSGSVSAGGSIMTLLDETDTLRSIPTSSCFFYMFYDCSALITPPALPATSLTLMCYYGMFKDCTNLTSAPNLPALSVAEMAYSNMFFECTSLTTAPIILATTVQDSGCSSMFAYCTSLATAPVLSATTVYGYAYSAMFRRCQSLTTLPALPATQLYYGCYSYMFDGCTSLYVSDAPEAGVAEQAWTIPSSGTFTNAITMSQMFFDCLGTRSSYDMVPTAGSNKTYYTQNTPIS